MRLFSYCSIKKVVTTNLRGKIGKKFKENSTKKAALDYHEFPQPGKLEIRATKPLANQRDLSRAYSPGVAEACLEIKEDENTASKYTSKEI